MADQAHPVEALIVLTHDVQRDGQPRACGKVAMHVSLSYLITIKEGNAQLRCRGCHHDLALEDVSGDEPYIPEYLPPAGHI